MTMSKHFKDTLWTLAGLVIASALIGIWNMSIEIRDTVRVTSASVAEIKSVEPIGRKEFDKFKTKIDSDMQDIADRSGIDFDGHVSKQRTENIMPKTTEHIR